MEIKMNWKSCGTAALVTMALAFGSAAHAGSDDKANADEMKKAREEVEKARVELEKATHELARAMADAQKDNPKAQYYAYITNPNRAVLGVMLSDEMENGETRGARLLAVTPGSGADKAGLKAGDLVIALNGQSIAAERGDDHTPQRKVHDVMRKLKAGDTVKVDYERDGKRAQTTVTTQPPDRDLGLMSAMESVKPLLNPEEMDRRMMQGMWWRGHPMGFELAKLDEDLASYFKTKEGVLVVKAPKSSALTLKGGDVIQKVNGEAVSDPMEVMDKLRDMDREKPVKLSVVRQGRKMELEGKVDLREHEYKRGGPPPGKPGDDDDDH